MLLKTKFSQLAASEQYTVLWSFVHCKCFWNRTKSVPPFFSWILTLKPLPSISRLFCIKTKLLDGRSHVKSAWGVSMGNRSGMPVGLRMAPAEQRLPLLLPPSPPGQPAPGHAGPKQQEERRAVQRVPLNHATQKRCDEKQVPVHSQSNCGQKNPYDSSLWY